MEFTTASIHLDIIDAFPLGGEYTGDDGEQCSWTTQPLYEERKIPHEFGQLFLLRTIITRNGETLSMQSPYFVPEDFHSKVADALDLAADALIR